ncbi:Desumoylating isopeptidase 1 [Balamuthia mandrillaris]
MEGQQQQQQSRSYPVKVHLYDLSAGMARQLSMQFLGKQIEGIWHTGVVVYGAEYFFGGGGGICCDAPGLTPYGTPVQVIDMGTTTVPKETFLRHLRSLEESGRFAGWAYRLLDNNCNNFSAEVCTFLTGKPIPSYITSLPQEFISTPIGQMMLPMIESMQSRLQETAHHFGGPLPSQATATNVGSGGGIPTDLVGPLLNSLNNGSNSTVSSLPTPTPTSSTTTTNTSSSSPLHPHHSLSSLNHLKHSDPVLLDSGAEHAPKIMEKLREFISKEADKEETQPASLRLTPEETQLLGEVEKTIKSLKAISAAAGRAAIRLKSAEQTYALMRKLIEGLSVESLFPCLDVLRLLLCIPSVNVHYATTEFDVIVGILKRFVTEKPAGVTIPKGVSIMTLRMAANMFATPQGASAMLSPDHISSLSDVISEGILSSEKSCRLAGSTLAYNCSLYLSKAAEDAVTQVMSALIHALNEEASSLATDECGFIMLMALGHLLFANDAAVELAGILGLELKPFIDSSVSKIKEVAKEVALLLPQP